MIRSAGNLGSPRYARARSDDSVHRGLAISAGTRKL